MTFGDYFSFRRFQAIIGKEFVQMRRDRVTFAMMEDNGVNRMHRAIIKALGLRQADYKFGHAAVHDLGGFQLLDSYHCSRYNTNTGRLTREMFEKVFASAREMLQN